MLTLEAMVSEEILICPRCASAVGPVDEYWRCSNVDCRYGIYPFPVISSLPALVDFENSFLDPVRLRATEGASVVQRNRRLPRSLRRLIHGRNEVAPLAVAKMLDLLRADSAATGRRPRILVIGGGAIGSGLEALYTDDTVDLIGFDVYASPVVQFIADGHGIPLAAASVDGVIVQAVLSYVLEPWTVAQEIHRVLRENGVVFADSPFMQQVVEGAFDFIRFTDSGLQYLFRGFERIESGAVAGAGTALLWSIDAFVRALSRSIVIGRLVQLSLFWLKYTDALLDTKHSLDGASGVFFLGRKVLAPNAQGDIVGFYRGGLSSR
jgi:SAM-dependent methyltransferase